VNIFVGADHRGVETKSRIIEIVGDLGHKIKDMGAHSEDSCDYPLIAYKVGQAVVSSPDSRGILVCMSGIGQAIAANKIDGVLAALCYNAEAAELSRLHNNANILVLSTKFVPEQNLEGILKVWLETEFEGGRHGRRVNLIHDIESGIDITNND